MKRGWKAVLAGAAVLLAGGTWWSLGLPGAARAESGITAVDPDTMRLVEPTVRIKVELLNASGERGMARRAMHYFRARGFDVVSVGNASERVEESVVLDRTGRPEFALLAARAAGSARVESRPDDSHYLDLTILLGAAFRPPAQVLYP